MHREPVHPQSDPFPKPPPIPVAVRSDVPCIECGYSLRGLATSGNCPECGTPIKASFLLPITKVQRQHARLRDPRIRAAGCALGALFVGLMLLLIWVVIG